MSFRKATAVLTEADGQRIKIIATYGVENSFSSPHISVTGEVYYEEPSGQFPQEPDACGQVIEDIKRAFPWLTTLMNLHLANTRTGEPMHALANGWYFLNGEPGYGQKGMITEASRNKAAQYLRTTPDILANVTSKKELQTLIDTVLCHAWEQQVHAVLALYGFTDESKITSHTSLNGLTLLYTDDEGCTYEQPLSDLSEVGLLVDPETDEELNLIGYRLR